MKEENKKSVLLYVIISIVIIIYLGFINITNWLLVILSFISYLIYAFKKVKTFNKCTQALIYPLTEITCMYIITGGTATISEILELVNVFLPILLAINIIVIMDAIKEWNINKRKNQNLQAENKKECKKFINSACFYINVSIVIILYLLCIVSPYGDKGNFFSEGINPEPSMIITYKLMIIPIFTIYIIYVLKKINIFNKYIKILIYPLTEITMIMLILFYLSTFGCGAILVMFGIIPILPILLIVDIIVIIDAVKELFINIRKKQNKQVQQDKK